MVQLQGILDKLLAVLADSWTTETSVFIAQLTPDRWLDDFGTVRLKGPRQCGQSTALVNAANRILKSGQKVCVVAPYVSQLELLKDKGCGGVLMTPSQLTKYEGDRFDYVFVDAASGLGPRSLANVREFAMRFLAQGHPVGLVLVG